MAVITKWLITEVAVRWGSTVIKKNDQIPIVVLNAVNFIKIVHSKLHSIKLLVTNFTLKTVGVETFSCCSQNLNKN